MSRAAARDEDATLLARERSPPAGQHDKFVTLAALHRGCKFIRHRPPHAASHARYGLGLDGGDGSIALGTDTRFDAILFGCVLGMVANPVLGDRVECLERNAKRWAACGLGLIAATFAYRNQLFRDTIRYTLQQIALMPIFFLIIRPERNWIARVLEGKWLRHLGVLSYSMYLIHHTLFHHFYHYVYYDYDRHCFFELEGKLLCFFYF